MNSIIPISVSKGIDSSGAQLTGLLLLGCCWNSCSEPSVVVCGLWLVCSSLESSAIMQKNKIVCKIHTNTPGQNYHTFLKVKHGTI